MKEIEIILQKQQWKVEDIVRLLNCSKEESTLLFEKAYEVMKMVRGDKVYLRGLIELSNYCSKDCFYCGIRKSNANLDRYMLSDDEVLQAAQYAYQNKYGSVVIQAGELASPAWTDKIEKLIREIKKIGDGRLGITLSLGEQDEETYKRWYEAGAHRYLLRIETTDQNLYKQIHPHDTRHSFERRLQALQLLRKCGYQVGTGVMIGLPGQTIYSLAQDLLFMKDFDIDMCGMGPYIEHHDTPMYQEKHKLLPPEERLFLSLKMVAVLRLMMPDINIAATTAMETLHADGRIMAFRSGANIVMPNITPEKYHDKYLLYDNKAGMKDQIEMTKIKIIKDIYKAGLKPGLSEWGDSLHFAKRVGSK